MLEDQSKLHESREDRRRQDEIMFAFCGRWRLCAISMPPQSPYDLTLVKDCNPTSLAEIKWRDHPFGTYQTYTIDADKVDTICTEAETQGLKPILIVSWQGDIRFTRLRPPYPVTEQKRHDRDELPDRVYHIPIGNFR